MKKSTLLFLFVLFGISTNYAQDVYNTTALPFLTIAPDARSGGLADMGVATSPDANSQFFNPAKYAFSDAQYKLGVNYTPWLRNLTDDTFLGSLVFSSKINERSAWGASMRYFSYGDIELSDGTTEKPNDFAIDGSYSLKFSENLSGGITLRYIRSDFAIKSQDNDLKTVNTFATDVAGFYQSDEKSYGSFNGIWRAGLNVSNIGPKIKYTDDGEKNSIPTNLGLGGGFEFILTDLTSITTNLEYDKLLVSGSGFDEFIWAFSTEYSYKEIMKFRAGYFNETDNAGGRQFFTVGGGFKFKGSTLDFSYLINKSDVTNPLENTLRFSLTFDFGDIYDQVYVKQVEPEEEIIEIEN